MKKIFALLLAAVMLLSFAACGNSETQPTETQPEETLPPRGNQVGDLCYGFDLAVADENGVTGQIIDPSATGKVTILNFWGTWCNPCVNELPHMEQIAKDYSEDVVVIAVHSQQDKKSMTKFLQEKYPDSPIIFAYDEDVEGGYNGEYYMLLEAPLLYPYSLILDANGVITEIHTGAVDYETFQKAVENAGAEKNN